MGGRKTVVKITTVIVRACRNNKETLEVVTNDVLNSKTKSQTSRHTRQIVDKETVDEIIFRTAYKRNRPMLELMVRGGVRIGEVFFNHTIHSNWGGV